MSPARDLPVTNGHSRVQSKLAACHPLAPLSENEIINASSLIQALWSSSTVLHFKTITLREPPKAEVLPFLEAEHAGRPPNSSIDRKATVDYYIRNTVGPSFLYNVQQLTDVTG